jgi:hypothetical protein
MYKKELKGEALGYVHEAAQIVPKGIFIKNERIEDEQVAGKLIVDKMFEETWLKDLNQYWLQNISIFDNKLSIATEIFESGLLNADDKFFAYVKLLEKCGDLYKSFGSTAEKGFLMKSIETMVFSKIGLIDDNILVIDENYKLQEKQKEKYEKVIDVAIGFMGSSEPSIHSDFFLIDKVAEKIKSINVVYSEKDKIHRMYQELTHENGFSSVIDYVKREVLIILATKLEKIGNKDGVQDILKVVAEMNITNQQDIRRNQFMKDVGILPRK